MIVVLLILHGLLAVALLGAITHQALSVLASCVARRIRTNSGMPFVSKPSNPPIVVSEPTMPASVTKKSVPL